MLMPYLGQARKQLQWSLHISDS